MIHDGRMRIFVDAGTKDNEKLSDCEGLSLLLGAPKGPPHDLVDGIIDIESNHLGCSSIDEVLEFSNYVERQNFNHASTCKAELPIESLKLLSQEGGVLNTEVNRPI